MDQEHREVSNKLIKITCMSLLFMGVELAGGYLANSIAIFADAFHLLSDVLAYLISLGAVWLSTRPQAPAYLTFGWEKAEPLGALVNVIVIYIVTGELFVEATKRMVNKEVVDEPKYMLITSVFGLICNVIIMGILHNDPHGGHHGCSHGHSHGHEHEHNHDHHALESCSSAHTHAHEHTHSSSCSHNHNSSQHHHSPSEHKHSPSEHNHSPCQHDHSPAEHHHDHSPHGPHQHGATCSHNHHQHNHQHISNEKNRSEERSSGDELKDTIAHHHHKCTKDEICIEGSLNSDEEIHVKAEPPKKIKNINLEAAYIHILTDIILSIGVIISALIIYFLAPDHHTWSAWQLADPLCTYLFSFLAIWSTWPILKESVLLLLDASHDEALVNDLRREIADLSGVKQLVDLKVWSTNRKKHYGAVRVRVEEGYGCWRVKQLLRLKGVEGYVQVQSGEGLGLIQGH